MSNLSRKRFVHQTHDLVTPAPLPLSLRARIRAKIVVWQSRIAARRHLAMLDARSLRDAGISPAAAAFESGRPFWHKMGTLR